MLQLPFPPPTKRLKFRNWQDSDTEVFVSMNLDKEVMEFFPSIQSRDETLKSIQRIRNGLELNGFGLYALEKIDDSSFIGFTGFSIPRFESYFTPCVEIGWRLSRNSWNKGFATEAARACIDFGFTVLKFKEIYSFTALTNKKSSHIMEKIGMTEAGMFEHPLIENGHPLKTHVLYLLDKKDYVGE